MLVGGAETVLELEEAALLAGAEEVWLEEEAGGCEETVEDAAEDVLELVLEAEPDSSSSGYTVLANLPTVSKRVWPCRFM